MNMIERKIKVVVDWDMCLRVPDEDRKLARPTHPYRCILCAFNGMQTGKLRFDGEPIPICNDHVGEDGLPIPVEMAPSQKTGGLPDVALAG